MTVNWQNENKTGCDPENVAKEEAATLMVDVSHDPETKEDSISDVSNVPERDNWTGRLDFLLSCIGYAVGLGNIWRFPYLCYKNGGGAFLIPYFFCLFVSGIPMFLMEVSLGQFMSRGCIMSWQICPLFQGIGYATTVVNILCSQYYIVILAWSLFFLFKSLTLQLPWATCDNEWNTEMCVETKRTTDPEIALLEGLDYDNGTKALPNCDGNLTASCISSVEEFWKNEVLHISGGLDEFGSLVWPLVLCLLLAWVLVYFIIWKGVKSSGKVVYFTATFPYIMLTVLLIRGVTLEGAGNGLLYYLKPDLSQLKYASVWVDAGSQIFYSYAVGFGTLTALGSYNKFHNDCYKDTLIVAAFNCMTSFYGGLVIFSVLGFMAHEQGVDIGDVADKGPGLVFIAYPKAVSMMPAAPLWSVLFFFMIVLVGLDSQFVAVEGLITAIIDIFPRHLRGGYRREIFTLMICVALFFSGLIFLTNGGMYIFKLYDYYSASYPLFIFGAMESFVIAWIYGVDRFCDDLEFMIGYRPFIWFKICWKYLVSILATVILGFALANYVPTVYNGYSYPAWGEIIGWSLSIVSVILIPVTMVVLLLRTEGTFLQRCHILIKPCLQPHQMRPIGTEQFRLAGLHDVCQEESRVQ